MQKLKLNNTPWIVNEFNIARSDLMDDDSLFIQIKAKAIQMPIQEKKRQYMPIMF